MSDNNDAQIIKFSKEQFLALLKIVYLGNWVANAQRGDVPTNPRLKVYESIENYIFSYAKSFGLAEYVDDELAENGQYFPTRMFEESQDIFELIDEYDDNTFWDELVERLADRDFEKHYTESEIQKMTNGERMNKLYTFIDKWAEEIYQNSLDNLDLTKTKHGKD